jgi:non-haem Fe2+, alpha-ketoglutarate-dependent halogenase
MPRELSPEAVAAYRRDGFFFPHRIMPREEALGIGRDFMAFAQGEVPKRYQDPQHQLFLLKAHLLFTWADRIAHDEGLLDAVESLIGPDIMVWSSGVFWKAPRSGSYVSWHQDSTNFELDDAEKVVRAWVALTPATLENGTMRFLPGLHRQGQIPHRDLKAEGELLSRGETIDLAIDETATVAVEIDAGEVSFHHLHTPHGSGPNDSDRRGPTTSSPSSPPRSARPPAGTAPSSPAGQDRFGHFAHEPRPVADMDTSARAAHEEAMALRNAIIYRGTALPPPRTTERPGVDAHHPGPGGLPRPVHCPRRPLRPARHAGRLGGRERLCRRAGPDLQSGHLRPREGGREPGLLRRGQGACSKATGFRSPSSPPTARATASPSIRPTT